MDSINSPDDMIDFVANTAKRAVNKCFEANVKYIADNSVKELQLLVSLVTGKEVVNQDIGFEVCDDDPNVIGACQENLVGLPPRMNWQNNFKNHLTNSKYDSIL